MKLKGAVDMVASERRLAQADLQIDENGLFVNVPEKKARIPREHATLNSARAYIENLMKRKQISIKWSETYDDALNTHLHLPEITLVYDKSGAYLRSEPPKRKKTLAL